MGKSGTVLISSGEKIRDGTCGRGALPVGFAPMRQRDHVDALGGVVDQVEDAVMAHADAIGVLTLKFLDSKGSRVLFERE